METVKLPQSAINKYYELRTTPVESNFQDCITWKGHYRTLVNGNRAACLVDGLEVYYASLVGFAIERNNNEYPLIWPTSSCGNRWCVNGHHIVLPAKKGRKRVESLEQTVRYKEKYEFVKGLLEAAVDPDDLLTSYIIEQLQENDLGGKTSTLLAIIGRVRQELGLRTRVVHKRSKVATSVG